MNTTDMQKLLDVDPPERLWRKIKAKLRRNRSAAASARRNYVPVGKGGKRNQWILDNPEKYMCLQAKHHAKKLGVPFSISAADIHIPKTCPVLGIPLERYKNRDNSPSLDRVICSLGYTPENIRVISGRANRLKSDASLEELRKIMEYIECSMPQP